MKKILVKYFDKNMPELTLTEKGDWIDLRVCSVEIINKKESYINFDSVEYEAGDFLKIGCGIAMQLPENTEAHVVPRSSTFKNYGLIQTNHMGVIDNSYCGDNDEWFIPMFALRNGKINKYDRLAQFRIYDKMKDVELIKVENLNNKDRGGFGSTGTK